MMKKWPLILIVMVGILLVKASVFQVDETQLCVITQFGDPVRQIKNPGLHFKWPYQVKSIMDKRIQVFNPKPMEFLTTDKQNIILDGFISWKINQEQTLIFLKSMGTKWNVSLFLTDIFTSEVGAAMGQYKLENLISTDKSALKTAEIMNDITKKCITAASENGIEILGVRIKKINVPEENKESVYARMIEERSRIAKKYRAEGEEKSMVIKAEADKEKATILAEAKKQSDLILGEANAKAADIYSSAHSKNPQFFSFMRTLEAYEKFLDDKTTIVLSRDSELLNLLSIGK